MSKTKRLALTGSVLTVVSFLFGLLYSNLANIAMILAILVLGSFVLLGSACFFVLWVMAMSLLTAVAFLIHSPVTYFVLLFTAALYFIHHARR
ncbi:MAG TPA: hypothetical protein EYN91_04525 [Candidatus Melainabacteria bacterium]|jgi:hypothetical protein|nr:hypothetical protein [Candidatus Melainabacteria bacterium]HIN67636.1 hypothetical protein [Candidatus Obscuribacterales bacterium]